MTSHHFPSLRKKKNSILIHITLSHSAHVAHLNKQILTDRLKYLLTFSFHFFQLSVKWKEKLTLEEATFFYLFVLCRFFIWNGVLEILDIAICERGVVNQHFHKVTFFLVAFLGYW